MADPIKVIVTSKKHLEAKYGSHFPEVEKLLAALVKADKKRKLQTKVVYIDDAASVKKAGISVAKSITRKRCKVAVDALYEKLQPVYIVLFGAQDIIPFQEINNPAQDDDEIVPSDLPYACDTPYGRKIAAFTGPSRVVGRIPDIPGNGDIAYLKTVFEAIINFQPAAAETLTDYFAVTADVWKKSTQLSLTNIFGNNKDLKESPPAKTGYPLKDLTALTHFYNCHGAPIDSRYYGQKGNSFPVAQDAVDMDGKISYGTVVAAECCYGAQLYDPNEADNGSMSIANMYFKNQAISLAGSSTIAYGPSDEMGLADLVTQYFIINILSGASAGRALLEARQQFLSESGPHLDPYELKTLAQFYLLGDPSVQPVIKETKAIAKETILNRRMNLFNKGLNLTASILPSELIAAPKQKPSKASGKTLSQIFKAAGFSGKETTHAYRIKFEGGTMRSFSKGLMGVGSVTFRTYSKTPKRIKKKFNIGKVLVIKESGSQILGWKVYHRR